MQHDDLCDCVRCIVTRVERREGERRERDRRESLRLTEDRRKGDRRVLRTWEMAS